VRVPFQPLERLYREQQNELDQVVTRVANSGWYIPGPEVEIFERAFADSVGCTHCIGVGNGFDGPHLSLLALDIGPGDEVVVPANTYAATWLAVMAAGATPVPLEPEPDGFNGVRRRGEPQRGERPCQGRQGLVMQAEQDCVAQHAWNNLGRKTGKMGRLFFPRPLSSG